MLPYTPMVPTQQLLSRICI